METVNKDEKQDCGCSDGSCCPPKKNNKWTKIIFTVVILAALAIVIMKFTCGSCKTEEGCKTTNTEKVGTNDTTAKPCCSQPNANCGEKNKK